MLETLFIQILFVLIIIETVAAFAPYFAGVKEVNPLATLLEAHMSDAKLARGLSGIIPLMIISFGYILLKGGHWSLWLIGCIYYAWLIGYKIYLAEKS